MKDETIKELIKELNAFPGTISLTKLLETITVNGNMAQIQVTITLDEDEFIDL